MRSGLLLLLSFCSLIACDPGTASDRAGDKDTIPATTGDTLLRDGLHVERDAKGLPVIEGYVKNGQRDGVWTSYNANGKVKSRDSYVRGVLQGPTVTFRDNGAMFYIGQHRNGVRSGEWKFYDEQGELQRSVTFDSTGVEVPAH
ncbi:MAG TPA: hypothetical protein VGE21_07325 [Flavobacteriales bacterium]